MLRTLNVENQEVTEVRAITNITKEYPKMIQVLVYKEPVVIPSHQARTGKRKKRKNFTPSERSVRRTQQTIKDIVLCNDFELFCTFTFDSAKIDRYDINACFTAMSGFLHNAKYTHSRALKWLVVPEHHKDGAFHFHALLSGYNGILKATKCHQNGRQIFNISGWRRGFSTAVKIDNKDAVANYVRKYITKDMMTEFGRRRYFASRNLVRPVKTINSDKFKNSLPLFRQKVYEGNDYDIWTLQPL